MILYISGEHMYFKKLTGEQRRYKGTTHLIGDIA